MVFREDELENHPEGLTEPQEKLCKELFAVGAVKIDTKKGFRLKLHETNPEAPLSPIYLNLRDIPGSPEIKELAIKVYKELMMQLKFDVIAGIPVAATAMASSLADEFKVGLRTPRVEKKTHGAESQIDGAMPGDENQTALLLDDLVTGAHSKIEAAEVLRQRYIVTDVVVLINRGGNKAVQQLQSSNLTLHAAFTLEQMLDYLVRVGEVTSEDRAIVMAYISGK